MSEIGARRTGSSTRTSRTRWAAVIAIIVVAATAVAVIGVKVWNAHNALSQGSTSDCARAQETIDSARNLSHDKAAAAAWQTEMIRRHQGMDDGYLQAQVAVYEDYAVRIATGEDKPTAAQIKDVTARLKGHCAKNGPQLNVVFPPSP
jgi:hypothetical protein